MFWSKRSTASNGGPPATEDAPTTTPPIRLLVVDGTATPGRAAEDGGGNGCPYDVDWKRLFAPHGAVVRVEQCGWDELQVTSDHCGGVASRARRSALDVRIARRRVVGTAAVAGRETAWPRTASFRPNFLLVRNECRTAGEDYRNDLFGFLHNGATTLKGAVNSLHSIYCFLERPIVHGELVRVFEDEARRRGGRSSRFAAPIVEQSFFGSSREMFYGNRFPCVAKVGHAHAGRGKMRIADHRDFEDFRSVLAMTAHYCTAEPFLTLDARHDDENATIAELGLLLGRGGEFLLPPEFDLRIQRIGENVRVFRRFSTAGNWKTNVGTSVLEEISGLLDEERLERYRDWARIAGEGMFGGLDILSIDVVCRMEGLKDGKTLVRGKHDGGKPLTELNPEFTCPGDLLKALAWSEAIIEVNGTSSGLGPEFEQEDNEQIRDLVLARAREAVGE